MPYGYEPYHALQGAIAKQAAQDFRRALTGGRKALAAALRRWFTSDYGDAVCMEQGAAIVRRIEEEVQEKK